MIWNMALPCTACFGIPTVPKKSVFPNHFSAGTVSGQALRTSLRGKIGMASGSSFAQMMCFLALNEFAIVKRLAEKCLTFLLLLSWHNLNLYAILIAQNKDEERSRYGNR